MRASVVGAAVTGLLLLTGIASGAPAAVTFTDSAGDANQSPDITSLSVSEPVAGTLSIAVAVGNFQALPDDSWFNLWFDTDNNPATGDAGDEALVRFLAGGALEHYVWDGTELSQRPPTGMTGSFAAGALTLTIPKTALGAITSFGILAVASRGQEQPGNELYIASDFAPDQGGGETPPRARWTGPAATFPDAANDHAAAPDITRVRVTDAKTGWITFAISTPNRATLPAASVLLVGIDVDNNAKTGSAGIDAALSILDGTIDLQRWNTRTRRFVADKAPTRIKGRNGSNVVTIEVHRSELDNAPRFGFHLTGLDFDPTSGDRQALDIAPALLAREPGRDKAARRRGRRCTGAAAAGCSVHDQRSDPEIGHQEGDHLRDGDLQRHRGRSTRARGGESPSREGAVHAPGPGGRDRGPRLVDRALGGRDGRLALLLQRGLVRATTPLVRGAVASAAGSVADELIWAASPGARSSCASRLSRVRRWATRHASRGRSARRRSHRLA
jgi:hypothetical protein